MNFKRVVLIFLTLIVVLSSLVFAGVKVNPDILYELGKKKYETAQYQEAVEYFKKAIDSGLSENKKKEIKHAICTSFSSELNKNHIDKAIILLHYDIINIKDCILNIKINPFEIAIENNSPKLVLLLLKHGLDINSKCSMNFTPLLTAISHNRIQIVKILIDNGADANMAAHTYVYVEENGKQIKSEIVVIPIIAATSLNNLEMAKLLLKSGIDIHQRNNIDNDALMDSIKRNNLQMVNLLLTYGANPNLKDKNGISSFCLFYSNFKEKRNHVEYQEIYKIFKEHGADGDHCQL